MSNIELSPTQNAILNIDIAKFRRLQSSSGVRNNVYFADNSFINIDFNSTLKKQWSNTTDEEFLVYIKSYLIDHIDDYYHEQLKGIRN